MLSLQAFWNGVNIAFSLRLHFGCFLQYSWQTPRAFDLGETKAQTQDWNWDVSFLLRLLSEHWLCIATVLSNSLIIIPLYFTSGTGVGHSTRQTAGSQHKMKFVCARVIIPVVIELKYIFEFRAQCCHYTLFQTALLIYLFRCRTCSIINLPSVRVLVLYYFTGTCFYRASNVNRLQRWHMLWIFCML